MGGSGDWSPCASPATAGPAAPSGPTWRPSLMSASTMLLYQPTGQEMSPIHWPGMTRPGLQGGQRQRAVQGGWAATGGRRRSVRGSNRQMAGPAPPAAGTAPAHAGQCRHAAVSLAGGLQAAGRHPGRRDAGHAPRSSHSQAQGGHGGVAGESLDGPAGGQGPRRQAAEEQGEPEHFVRGPFTQTLARGPGDVRK